MAFKLEMLGQWSDARETKVDAVRTTAYAAATNDDNPRHTSGELAPPVFAVVPIWDSMIEVVGRITPPEVLMRVVHGDQDMRFHRPIVPGDLLRSRAGALGVTVRGTGTTLLIKAESRDGSGAMVNEQYITMFFRGASDGDSGGEEPPAHKLTAEVKAGGRAAEFAYPVDADQTFRYAEASGDRMPIHLDDALARSVGLPGIIVHGLCTMAFAGRAVVDGACGGDPTRLARLAVRFSRPVLPGQTVTTALYDAGSGHCGFEVLNPDGQAVVKDGRAEIRGAN